MINEQKIAIYRKYNGLQDAYTFEKGNSQDEDIDPTDWSLIAELIGKIILLKSGKASADFEKELMRIIENKAENQRVIAQLEEMAREKLTAK